MKKQFLHLVLLLILLLSPFSYASATDYTVRPFLIDKTLEPRQTITETVVLTNNVEFTKYLVYATVNEISVDTEGEIKNFVSPVMTDRTNTITSWIEVRRGRIEVAAGERVEVPLTIRVNPFAEPGEYHAFVGFVRAPNRAQAEEIAMRGEADGVIVKVTIEDQRTDSMRIAGFLIDRFITNDDRREVEVVLENTGDLPSAPQGEIIFYDSKGVEVDSVPFNTDGVVVQPGETTTLTGTVPLSENLGRFKANISLKYGENQRASLFDTTSFYLMPLSTLLGIFAIILFIAIALALLLRRALADGHDDDEHGEDVVMFVKEGHEADPQDHDINLKENEK